MSELINNSERRKEILKHMLLQLHKGEAPEAVKVSLGELLKKIPYDEVVEVEQQLIKEGMPASEIQKFCDIHSKVLEGKVDTSAQQLVPAGHPVDTFRKENKELTKLIDTLEELFEFAETVSNNDVPELLLRFKTKLNSLMDIEKHYQRKEYLVFPYLEKHEITGPPTVMWGKHDEVRAQLKASIEALNTPGEISSEDLLGTIDFLLKPTAKSILDMILKEEEILLPMTMDKLSYQEWYHIYKQSDEFGYCLFDPTEEWKPVGLAISEEITESKNNLTLHSGSFTSAEISALLNTLPADITFVDKNDKVKFFSQGKHRIFPRNRAILGRDVRMCHPPSSVNVVEKIISDFKSGKEESAPFWITMGEKFIHIEYFAMRDKDGSYLGTLEVSQDLTEQRKLEGEQRLLSYAKAL